MISHIREMKVSKLNIICVMLYILSFSFISSTYWPQYDYVKYVFILLIGIYLMFNNSFIASEKFRYINLILVIFSALVVTFSFINKDTLYYRNSFLASIVYVLMVLEIFFVLELVSIKHKSAYILNLYYKLTRFWCLFLDLCIIIYPDFIMHEGVYIVGTKFQISYINILFYALFLSRNGLNNSMSLKSKSVFIFLINIFVSIRIGCMTGVIGALAYLTGYLLFSKKNTLLHKPILLAVSFILCGLFPICYEVVVDNSIFQNLLVNVLGRSSTLTGRVNIYKILPIILKGHVLTGYGVGSEYEICQRYFAYADVQNGIMSWILQYGLIATLLFIFGFLIIFSYIRNSSSDVITSLVMFIYVFILIGTIEISFQFMFIGIFALLLCVAKDIKSEEILL